MKNILLLEDDLSAALDIELMVNDMDGFELIRVSNIKDAEQAFQNKRPDVIIADIYLDDGEVSLSWLHDKTRHIPTIILTGNYTDEYFEKAKAIDARAYLMKPINPVTLRYELERIFVLKEKPGPKKVIIKDGAKLHVFRTDELIWVRAEGNYSTILTSTKKIVIKTSLLKISNQLSNDEFIKVHRSAIVALNKIKLIDTDTDSVIMTDETSIPLGKTYKSDVKIRINKIGNRL